MSTTSQHVPALPPQHRGAPAVRPDHRWRLADGTVLHAPYGELLRDGDGRLCCHLCGRWFRALGAHLRVHRYTAQAYREVFGLCTSVALVAEEVSARISRRQAAAYQASPLVRERLAPGQDMARSGQLQDRAREALAAPPPRQRAAVRAAALDTGRRSRAQAREADLEARLAALGYPGGVSALGQYLHDALHRRSEPGAAARRDRARSRPAPRRAARHRGRAAGTARGPPPTTLPPPGSVPRGGHRHAEVLRDHTFGLLGVGVVVRPGPRGRVGAQQRPHRRRGGGPLGDGGAARCAGGRSDHTAQGQHAVRVACPHSARREIGAIR